LTRSGVVGGENINNSPKINNYYTKNSLNMFHTIKENLNSSKIITHINTKTFNNKEDHLHESK
jgi:hypothetical protein